MRKYRDAGGAAGADRFAVDQEFAGKRLGQLLGQQHACDRLLAVDDHSELVAGEPGHDPAARRVLDPVRHFDQQFVADRMAEHVVDFLQAVEVDRQHREFLVGASAGLDHLRQRLQEGGAVRQVRQAVMIRHMRHPRLGLAAVGDILMGLDQVLRLAGIVEHRHAARQEQPQAVLGGDRVFLGEQAALLDRGFIAGDDQLGFARIEDIRGREAGGVLAPTVEDGLGAAIGQQISAVADAFDDQRHRNVVDHQLEEFLGVLELLGQRPAIGDIVEQGDQEFRPVLLVAGDHPDAREDALLGATLDHELVAELAIGRAERGLIRCLDACRRLGAEDLVGALADDVVAGKTGKAFECAIGEDVAAVVDILGGHAYRHIVEHRFQELLGRSKLPRQLALLAAILMRRHRAAVRQRKLSGHDRSPVRQLGHETFRSGGPGPEFLVAELDQAVAAPHFQQFRPGHVFRDIRTRQAVNLEIAIVTEYDSPLRIRHHHALTEVIQGGTDEGVSAQLCALDLAQRRVHPQRDCGEK